MTFVIGLILIAITVALVAIARPADGVSAKFLRNWVVGQAYALTAMVSAVMGITLVISNWPY